MSQPIVLSGFSVAAPSAGLTVSQGTAAGLLGVGVYNYAMTYMTNFGQTVASSSVSFTSAGGSAVLAFTAAPIEVVSVSLYRTAVGGSDLLLLASVPPSATSYLDVIADASLGTSSPPDVSTADSVEILDGNIIFQKPLAYSFTAGISALAAGGLSGAPVLKAEFNQVTTVSAAAASVALPYITQVGMRIRVLNDTATYALAVFAQSGQTVAGGASVSVAAGAAVDFIASSATAWIQC